MSKVITFSRFFPSYHYEKGKPTYFVEKILRGLYSSTRLMNDYFEKLNPNYNYTSTFRAELSHPMNYEPKHHTIRSGNRWKVGDKFSPRVWSGAPYNSKQIIIAPDIKIKKIWKIEISENEYCIKVDGKITCVWMGIENERFCKMANNDGLTVSEMRDWFNKPFKGQIICWGDVKY